MFKTFVLSFVVLGLLLQIPSVLSMTTVHEHSDKGHVEYVEAQPEQNLNNENTKTPCHKDEAESNVNVAEEECDLSCKCSSCSIFCGSANGFAVGQVGVAHRFIADTILSPTEARYPAGFSIPIFHPPKLA